MRTLAVVTCVACVGCGRPEPPADLDMYVLAGQSNMAGRGAISDGDRPPHPRVWVLGGDLRWGPARDPLHRDGPDAGVGPGLSFGEAVAAARPDRHVGLVPCAVGGSPLSRWERGGDLYVAMLGRAAEARKRGRLRAVLWHQGESDARSAALAASYGDRLTAAVADLREDLGEPDLPVVIGLLGPLPADRFPHRDEVNAALSALPGRVRRVAAVNSEGLTTGPDGVHLDAESARELGRRFAAALGQLE